MVFFINIFRLQLDWNNIGDSEDAFSQLCHSLMSNTVLNVLNLANNNLCQKCGFHLAKMLTINKCLKIIGKYYEQISRINIITYIIYNRYLYLLYFIRFFGLWHILTFFKTWLEFKLYATQIFAVFYQYYI